MDQVEVQPEIKTEVSNVQEKIETKIENQVSSSNIPETEKDINWKKFKEAREQERKHSLEMTKKAQEKEAEAHALKAALDALVNKPNSHQQQFSSNSFEEEETEDQRIDKKVQQAIAKRDEMYERQRKEKEAEEYPSRLRKEMKDFDSVCSSSNLDYLDYHYPEVSKPFAYMPDGYEKWAAVYKAVKRFIPNTDTRKDEAKMQSNLNKPQAVQSTMTNKGENGLTSQRELEARRSENYARMQRLIRGVG